MKRRTLDLIFSIAAVVIAVLLVLGGFTLRRDARFAEGYVVGQLSEEKLVFPTEDRLSDREIEFSKANTGCLIENVGKPLTTGKQAECYANEYIGNHLTWLATRLGMTQVAYVDGMRYAELGAEQGNLRTQIATAKENKPAEVPILEKTLADVTTVRTRMFEGSMLRNALLTTYGFSVLGERAAQASRVAFGAAAVLVLIALAGFVHAMITPKTRAFAPVETLDLRERAVAGVQ